MYWLGKDRRVLNAIKRHTTWNALVPASSVETAIEVTPTYADALTGSKFNVIIVDESGKIDRSQTPAMASALEEIEYTEPTQVIGATIKGPLYQIGSDYEGLFEIDPGESYFSQEDFIGTYPTTIPKSPSYDNLKVTELKALLKARGLKVGGNKPTLIARLKDADNSQSAPTGISGGSTAVPSGGGYDPMFIYTGEGFPTFEMMYGTDLTEKYQKTNNKSDLRLHVGLEPTLSATNKREALKDLKETKVPLLFSSEDEKDFFLFRDEEGEIDSLFKRFPTFIHLKTPKAELIEMAERIYEIPADEVKGKLEKQLRNYLLRFFPSPSFFKKLPMDSVREKAKQMGVDNPGLEVETERGLEILNVDVLDEMKEIYLGEETSIGRRYLPTETTRTPSTQLTRVKISLLPRFDDRLISGQKTLTTRNDAGAKRIGLGTDEIALAEIGQQKIERRVRSYGPVTFREAVEIAGGVSKYFEKEGIIPIGDDPILPSGRRLSFYEGIPDDASGDEKLKELANELNELANKGQEWIPGYGRFWIEGGRKLNLYSFSPVDSATSVATPKLSEQRKIIRQKDRDLGLRQATATRAFERQKVPVKPRYQVDRTGSISIPKAEWSIIQQEQSNTFCGFEDPTEYLRTDKLSHTASIFVNYEEIIEDIDAQDYTLLENADILNLGTYLRREVDITRILSPALNYIGSILFPLVRDAYLAPVDGVDTRKHVYINVDVLKDNFDDRAILTIDDITTEDIYGNEELFELRSWSIINEYVRNEPLDIVDSLIFNSELCIGFNFDSDWNLGEFLNIRLPDLLADDEATDFEQYLYRAILCKKQILVINKGGEYEYFDSIHNLFFSADDLELFFENGFTDNLANTMKALQEGAISAAPIPEDKPVTLTAVESSRKVKIQRDDRDPSFEEEGVSLSWVKSQEEAQKRKKRQQDKYLRVVSSGKTNLQVGTLVTQNVVNRANLKIKDPADFAVVSDVQIPVAVPPYQDPFLRTSEDDFNPRLIIIPVWDDKDVRSYISSYAKNIRNRDIRGALKSFVTSWANNSGYYFGSPYTQILSASEEIFDMNELDHNDWSPLVSIVTPRGLIPSLTEAKEINQFITTFNSPNFAQAKLDRDTESVFNSLGNKFFFQQFDSEPPQSKILPWHELGSGLLIQDGASGDQSADWGINILLVYMNDIEPVMEVRYRKEYSDKEGKKIPWLSPYLIPEPHDIDDVDELNEAIGEGFKRIQDTLISTLAFLHRQYNSFHEIKLSGSFCNQRGRCSPITID